VNEPRSKDQSRTGEGERCDPQDRRQQRAVPARSECVERELHDVHDQERDAEDDAVTAERVGDGKRSDEHRSHRNQHRPPDRAHIGVDRVGQPCVGRPRPPERGEDQEPVPEPTPRRIIR
jgi:hypothetical protein